MAEDATRRMQVDLDGFVREGAVQLAANDTRDVVARFGQLGVRKFAIAG